MLLTSLLKDDGNTNSTLDLSYIITQIKNYCKDRDTQLVECLPDTQENLGSVLSSFKNLMW